MARDLQTFVRRRYLFVRQQFRHLQALVAYLAGRRGPEKRFVLFGRGRSGTTALVSMLDGVPDVRCEGEVLHDCVPLPRFHVLGRSARVDDPVYGCKILSYQLRDVQRLAANGTGFIRRLHEEHEFSILYLRRMNLLRHALSNVRARKETFHRKKSDSDRERPAIHVDPEHVIEWMDSSAELNVYEQEVLEDVPHLSLTYEEHIRRPENHQATVDTVCSFLGVESTSVESAYRKVAPPSLRAGVANYDELADRLAGTPYAQFLD